MKDLIHNIICMLVDNPEDIRITGMSGANTLIFELRCNSDDIGKVIGKEGKTVGAVRALLNAIAARQGRRVFLEVVE